MFRTIYSLENHEDHQQRDLVDTLVLESPFNNLHDEIKHVVFESKDVIRQENRIYKYTMMNFNIFFRRSLGKVAPVIINSVLNSSDMMFRLVFISISTPFMF